MVSSLDSTPPSSPDRRTPLSTPPGTPPGMISPTAYSPLKPLNSPHKPFAFKAPTPRPLTRPLIRSFNARVEEYENRENLTPAPAAASSSSPIKAVVLEPVVAKRKLDDLKLPGVIDADEIEGFDEVEKLDETVSDESETESPVKKKKEPELSDEKKKELLGRVYKIVKNENGDLIVDLDNEVKKVKRVIYQFFRKTKDDDGNEKIVPLDGKTETTVAQRVNGYVFGFRHPEKEKGKGRFYDDVRAHPEEFFFKIRKFVGPAENICEAETLCIAEDDAVENGYNQNYGGGGSNKLDPALTVKTDKLVEPITPEKTYPLYSDEGGIGIKSSPGLTEKQNAIYFFRHSVKRKEYIGYTTTTVGERFSKWVSNFNNPGSEAGQRPLPQAVQQSPTKFICGVYGTFKEGEDPGVHETHCVETKKTRVPRGYNKAAPGGGGVSKNYGKRTKDD